MLFQNWQTNSVFNKQWYRKERIMDQYQLEMEERRADLKEAYEGLFSPLYNNTFSTNNDYFCEMEERRQEMVAEIYP